MQSFHSHVSPLRCYLIELGIEPPLRASRGAGIGDQHSALRCARTYSRHGLLDPDNAGHFGAADRLHRSPSFEGDAQAEAASIESVNSHVSKAIIVRDVVCLMVIGQPP